MNTFSQLQKWCGCIFVLWTHVKSSDQELWMGTIKWSMTIFTNQDSWSQSQTLYSHKHFLCVPLATPCTIRLSNNCKLIGASLNESHMDELVVAFLCVLYIVTCSSYFLCSCIMSQFKNDSIRTESAHNLPLQWLQWWELPHGEKITRVISSVKGICIYFRLTHSLCVEVSHGSTFSVVTVMGASIC